MDGAEWIRDELNSLECAGCGRTYAAGRIRMLGQGDACFLGDLACEECGARAVAIVTFESADGGVDIVVDPQERQRRGGRRGFSSRPRRREPPPADPVTADEVLEMHRFLDGFDGDFRRLFGAFPADPPHGRSVR
jgi:hypothetical protein